MKDKRSSEVVCEIDAPSPEILISMGEEVTVPSSSYVKYICFTSLEIILDKRFFRRTKQSSEGLGRLTK